MISAVFADVQNLDFFKNLAGKKYGSYFLSTTEWEQINANSYQFEEWIIPDSNFFYSHSIGSSKEFSDITEENFPKDYAHFLKLDGIANAITVFIHDSVNELYYVLPFNSFSRNPRFQIGALEGSSMYLHFPGCGDDAFYRLSLDENLENILYIENFDGDIIYKNFAIWIDHHFSKRITYALMKADKLLSNFCTEKIVDLNMYTWFYRFITLLKTASVDEIYEQYYLGLNDDQSAGFKVHQKLNQMKSIVELFDGKWSYSVNDKYIKHEVSTMQKFGYMATMNLSNLPRGSLLLESSDLINPNETVHQIQFFYPSVFGYTRERFFGLSRFSILTEKIDDRNYQFRVFRANYEAKIPDFNEGNIEIEWHLHKSFPESIHPEIIKWNIDVQNRKIFETQIQTKNN